MILLLLVLFELVVLYMLSYSVLHLEVPPSLLTDPMDSEYNKLFLWIRSF